MSESEGRTSLVVMGVAGSGKTTVAAILGERLGWPVAEADEFHSPENVAKMSAGTPLTDEDRQPWLAAIRDWISDTGGNSVVTCSALRRAYRDVLRQADARVRFVHLDGTRDEIAERMSARTDHFMPLGLLDSQLATLEPLEPDEDAVLVPIEGTPEQIAQTALDALNP